MTDQARTKADLIVQYADNSTGNITPQLLRDYVESVIGYGISGTTPSTPPAGIGYVYTQEVGGEIELFFINDSGSTCQLSNVDAGITEVVEDTAPVLGGDLDGDDFDITNTGSISLNNLTSGRITYAATSGLISDSANLTWNETSTLLGVGLGQTGTNPQKTFDISGDINFTQVNYPLMTSCTLTEDLGAYNLTAGTYYYSIEYVTSVGDTSGYDNGSARKSITLSGTARVLLTDIPVSSDPRVIARKIYRTVSGGAYYAQFLVATINDNTTTSYTDNVADGSLTTSDTRYRKDNHTVNGIYLNNSIFLTFGSYNFGLGNGALESLTTGHTNTAVGRSALQYLTSGSENIAVGSALGKLTTAQDNTAVGNGSMPNNTTGSYNTAVGAYTGYLGADGVITRGVFIGSHAGYLITNGNNDNVFIGYYAGRGFRGSKNTIVGTYSGWHGTAQNIGDSNVFIGYGVGNNTTAGASDNIFIGNGIEPDVAGGSYQLNIGGIIKGDLSPGSGSISIIGDLTIDDTLNLIDTDTQVFVDVSGNLTFKDAIVGTRTLKTIGCPVYKYIIATTQSEGDLHLTDSAAGDWNINKSLIKYIRVITDSTDWDMYLLQNDSGYATYDGVMPILQIMDAGNGNKTIYLDFPYEDEDVSGEVHLYYLDNSGSNTADIYIIGTELV